MQELQDEKWMEKALELAERGRGKVEPNPMVGCVIVNPKTGEKLGEGWHREYGGPHAEVNALLDAQKCGNSVEGATVYVTLEPCCHYGKTPPCAKALCEAHVGRVVAAMHDPFPKVDGGGFKLLTDAGIKVTVGVCESSAQRLNAPYLKLQLASRPWITAKWAMTLDGKIATRTGSSRWVSSVESRNFAHEQRARMDGILVGAGTVLADNPMLNARPQDGMIHRVATRIVADARLETPLNSQLVLSAREIPVLLAIGSDVPEEKVAPFRTAGCDIFRFTTPAEHDAPTGCVSRSAQMAELLDELGRRHMTNVLVEGGSSVLGAFFDLQEIDEVCVFIAPKLCGGRNAVTPVGGFGLAEMNSGGSLTDFSMTMLGGDIVCTARVQRPDAKEHLGNLDWNQREV